MLEVLQAPPFATVQDLGRPGHRAIGVPPSGAMDPHTLIHANAIVGNPVGAAGVEWALGAGRFRAYRPVVVCVGGPDVEALVGNSPSSPGTAISLQTDDVLTVLPPTRSRFGYLAIAGGLNVPEVLGSRSTYLPGGFGGWQGRLLRAGDRLPVGQVAGLRAEPPIRPPASGPLRVLRGPQFSLMDEEFWKHLEEGAWRVGSLSDRMGLRLEGPEISHRAPAGLPSEPACVGAIQCPNGAPPIVLMPDGPTVGGYPKAAVICTEDLGRAAQLRPGDPFRATLLD